MSEFQIYRVNVTKFLGVIIDSDLSWKSHTTEIKSKMYRSLAILKVKHTLISHVKAILYHSAVAPVLLC